VLHLFAEERETPLAEKCVSGKLMNLPAMKLASILVLREEPEWEMDTYSR